jgi:hypothetical protein
VASVGVVTRPIEFGPTTRGALLGKFTDRYGASCSLQESSYPEEDCIWLGVEVDSMGEPIDSGRMHLTRELARELAEALLHFASEGTLGFYDAGAYQVGRWVIGVGRDNHDVFGRIVEAHAGVRLKVEAKDSTVWECAWGLVPSSWVPTDPPPRARTLFEHLEING